MYGRRCLTYKEGTPRPYYAFYGEYEKASEVAFQNYLENGDRGLYESIILHLRDRYQVYAG